MNLLKTKRMVALYLILTAVAGSAFGQVPAQNVTNKFDGVVFADYFYNMDNSTPANKFQNAFTIRRIYFTWENNLTADIKWRFRLESESNAYGSTSKINPFVKHAYLEWANLIPNHLLYLGIAETNAFKNSEEYWGYRSIEKTIMDLNKISSSADLGLALKGDLNARYLHHWLTVMNGTGYGASEGDRYKKIGYALWLTPVRGLIIEGYADYEKQNPADLQTSTQMSAAKDYALASSYRTLKGFVGYSRPRYTVGIEAFQRTNTGSGVASATAKYDSTAKKYKASNVATSDIVRFGWSAFGSWITPVKNLKLFARYDAYDNNTGDETFTKFDESKGKLGGSGLNDETSLLIAGLDYIPSGNVHIMPNIMIKKYAEDANKDDDMTARLTLYVKFDSGKVYGE
jgi:hypothetical protein